MSVFYYIYPCAVGCCVDDIKKTIWYAYHHENVLWCCKCCHVANAVMLQMPWRYAYQIFFLHEAVLIKCSIFFSLYITICKNVMKSCKNVMKSWGTRSCGNVLLKLQDKAVCDVFFHSISITVFCGVPFDNAVTLVASHIVLHTHTHTHTHMHTSKSDIFQDWIVKTWVIRPLPTAAERREERPTAEKVERLSAECELCNIYMSLKDTWNTHTLHHQDDRQHVCCASS